MSVDGRYLPGYIFATAPVATIEAVERSQVRSMAVSTDGSRRCDIVVGSGPPEP